MNHRLYNKRTIEALQRSIFEEAPDAILLVTPSGLILRANLEAQRLFGYSRGQLQAMAVENLLPEGARYRHVGLRQDYFGAPQRRPMGSGMRLCGRRADGSEFPVDVMLSPLHANGEALVIATVRDITERLRQEEAMQAALCEKETLLKELYHRVKNNLQVISSLFNLQLRNLPEGMARDALKEGADRVRAMALVHEKLYQSGNLSSVALDDYVDDLCRQLHDAAAAERRQIHILIEAEPVQVGLETAVPLGLVLNELISNCLKHAFPEGGPGTVTVSLAHEEWGRVRLAVDDDGVGFPPGLKPAACQSLGLKLVSALAAQLDAKLELKNAGGACASLVFRLAKPSQANGELRLVASG